LDDVMTEPLIEMDAFELRWQLVHGLHPSDGLVVHVVDAGSLVIVGTDSAPHPKHGIYQATGRQIWMARATAWWVTRQAQCVLYGDTVVLSLADLDEHLAWVRRRTDP
jgi:hypothetical protein